MTASPPAWFQRFLVTYFVRPLKRAGGMTYGTVVVPLCSPRLQLRFNLIRHSLECCDTFPEREGYNVVGIVSLLSHVLGYAYERASSPLERGKPTMWWFNLIRHSLGGCDTVPEWGRLQLGIAF
jgi:hypothetical protein